MSGISYSRHGSAVSQSREQRIRVPEIPEFQGVSAFHRGQTPRPLQLGLKSKVWVLRAFKSIQTAASTRDVGIYDIRGVPSRHRPQIYLLMRPFELFSPRKSFAQSCTEPAFIYQHRTTETDSSTHNTEYKVKISFIPALCPAVHVHLICVAIVRKTSI